MKFRIIKQTRKCGKEEFIPQYGFLFFWFNFRKDYGPDVREVLVFDTIEAAQYHIVGYKSYLHSKENQKIISKTIIGA